MDCWTIYPIDQCLSQHVVNLWSESKVSGLSELWSLEPAAIGVSSQQLCTETLGLLFWAHCNACAHVLAVSWILNSLQNAVWITESTARMDQYIGSCLRMVGIWWVAWIPEMWFQTTCVNFHSEIPHVNFNRGIDHCELVASLRLKHIMFIDKVPQTLKPWRVELRHPDSRGRACCSWRLRSKWKIAAAEANRLLRGRWMSPPPTGFQSSRRADRWSKNSQFHFRSNKYGPHVARTPFSALLLFMPHVLHPNKWAKSNSQSSPDRQSWTWPAKWALWAIASHHCILWFVTGKYVATLTAFKFLQNKNILKLHWTKVTVKLSSPDVVCLWFCHVFPFFLWYTLERPIDKYRLNSHWPEEIYHALFHDVLYTWW